MDTVWILHTRDFRDRHGRQATETRFLLRPKGLLALMGASIALYSSGIMRSALGLTEGPRKWELVLLPYYRSNLLAFGVGVSGCWGARAR